MYNTFMKDLNDLSKFGFVCNNVFPFGAVIMTFRAMRNFYSLSFDKTNLNAIEGTVNNIRMESLSFN
jgi:hypothetical protein